MDRKHCTSCGEDKPSSQFYKNRGHRDGLSTYCQPCTKADRHRTWRAKHPEPPPYVIPTEKRCTRCGVTKPLDQFHRSKASRDGKKSDCATCCTAAAAAWNRARPEYHRQKANEYRLRHPEKVADRALRWRLGIPHGTYDRLFSEQEGKCAVCGTTEPGPRTTRFHVDHHHATGHVRALLCNNCNHGIGHFKESEELLYAAIAYLRRYRLSEGSVI